MGFVPLVGATNELEVFTYTTLPPPLPFVQFMLAVFAAGVVTIFNAWVVGAVQAAPEEKTSLTCGLTVPLLALFVATAHCEVELFTDRRPPEYVYIVGLVVVAVEV